MAEVIPIITQAGREALVSAQKNGISLEFTRVGFGTEKYTPQATQTDLRNRLRRIPIFQIKPILDSKTVFNIVVVVTDLDGDFDTEPNPNSFQVGEIGVYGRRVSGDLLQSIPENEGDDIPGEVLFSVFSTTDPGYVTTKLPGDRFAFSFNYAIDDAADSKIVISPPEAELQSTLVDTITVLAAEQSVIRRRQVQLDENQSTLGEEIRRLKQRLSVLEAGPVS